MTRYVRAYAAAACALLVLPACDRILPQQEDRSLPDIEVVEEAYGGLNAEYRYSGNVLEVVVQQPADHLRRGGSLWARVGPYIYLFTPATRQVLDRYSGIAGVRAVTMTGDTEVARALLQRDRLNELTWPRAHAVLGRALESGTERPSLMDRLVQFGEEHTTYRYNPEYVTPRQ